MPIIVLLVTFSKQCDLNSACFHCKLYNHNSMIGHNLSFNALVLTHNLNTPFLSSSRMSGKCNYNFENSNFQYFAFPFLTSTHSRMNLHADSLLFRHFLSSAVKVANDEQKISNKVYTKRFDFIDSQIIFEQCSFRDMISKNESGAIHISNQISEVPTSALFESCFFVNLTFEYAPAFFVDATSCESKNCYYYWILADFRYNSIKSTVKNDCNNSHYSSTYFYAGHKPNPSVSHGISLNNGIIEFYHNNISCTCCKEYDAIGEFYGGKKLDYYMNNHANISGMSLISFHAGEKNNHDIHDCTFNNVGAYNKRLDYFMYFAGNITIRKWYFYRCRQFSYIENHQGDTITFIDCETDLKESKASFQPENRVETENFKYGVSDIKIPTIPTNLPKECWTHIPTPSPAPPTATPAPTPSQSPMPTVTVPVINEPIKEPEFEDPEDENQYDQQKQSFTSSDIIQIGGLGILILAVIAVFILNHIKAKKVAAARYADEDQLFNPNSTHNAGVGVANH